MKSLARNSILVCVFVLITSGCYNGAPIRHPYEDSPPEGVIYPKTKYTILVVYGAYEQKEQGLAYERYHADIVKYSDGWVLFHDKTLDLNVRVPASRTTVMGGDDPILPFIKTER